MQVELEVQKLQRERKQGVLEQLQVILCGLQSFKVGMSRSKAGEIRRHPDHKEPSVIPDNEKSLKVLSRGMT